MFRVSCRTYPAEPDYIILDINTGMPVNGDTMANETRSAAAVEHDEELRDAATEAQAAQTGKPQIPRGSYNPIFTDGSRDT